MNYRVDETDKDDRRLYISHDNGNEYNCKIEGQQMWERNNNTKDAPSLAPASAARRLNP